jgi:hypothetical protein
MVKEGEISQNSEEMMNALKRIHCAMENLTAAEAICALEMAKFDIILNGKLIILDGIVGEEAKEWMQLHWNRT